MFATDNDSLNCIEIDGINDPSGPQKTVDYKNCFGVSNNFELSENRFSTFFLPQSVEVFSTAPHAVISILLSLLGSKSFCKLSNIVTIFSIPLDSKTACLAESAK